VFPIELLYTKVADHAQCVKNAKCFHRCSKTVPTVSTARRGERHNTFGLEQLVFFDECSQDSYMLRGSQVRAPRSPGLKSVLSGLAIYGSKSIIC
jgi:hypothetical protein